MAISGMGETVAEHVSGMARRPAALARGRSLVLVGLMGAGKSAIGRRIAHRLDMAFVDADTEIEIAANATIAEIFERDGEAAFRQGERRVIARLLAGPPIVLATGGGAFMDPTTRARIKERGLSVWLKADLETLVQRTAKRSHRPILNRGDPRDVLAKLMEIRHPIYAEADVTIESGAVPAEVTVERLLEILAKPV
jgi:shikimate kinase